MRNHIRTSHRRGGLFLTTAALALALSGCAAVPAKVGTGPLEVLITPGPGWLHRHPLFLGLTFQTPPQFAIWIEDESGAYVKTLFVTRKAANQGWLGSPGEKVPEGGIRRPESLPVWSHQRGIRSTDGLFMPTKASPATDAVSGATTSGSLTASFDGKPGQRKFRVLAEFNQSLDFNEHYPVSARPGDRGYSGGPLGSGQPSVIYAAHIDLDSNARIYPLSLIGHGASDGRDGSIDPDLSGITSAMEVVGDVSVRVTAEQAR